MVYKIIMAPLTFAIPYNELDAFSEYYHFNEFPHTTNKYIEILISDHMLLDYYQWLNTRENSRSVEPLLKETYVNLGFPEQRWVTLSYLLQKT